MLTAANWHTGAPWWSFWPLAAWGVVVAVHFLVYKTTTVDEDWVAQRAAELHTKSYDASHIAQIAADQGGAAGDREKT